MSVLNKTTAFRIQIRPYYEHVPRYSDGGAVNQDIEINRSFQ